MTKTNSLRIPRKFPYFYFITHVFRYVASFGGPFHVDATKAGNESRFINHSCEPNCSMNIVIQQKTRQLAIGIFTLAEIEPWTEITTDYSWTATAEKQLFLPCNCGSKKCRKNMYALVEPESQLLKRTPKPKGNLARAERAIFGPEGNQYFFL